VRQIKQIFLVIFLLWGISAFGQEIVGNPVVINSQGQPIGQALVAVCTTNPGTSTAPCSSLATLYTDSTLGYACTGTPGTQPLNNQGAVATTGGCSNPGFADGLGNLVAFTAAGQYWCQVYGSNVVTQVQPCVVPAGTPGGGTVTGGGTIGKLPEFTGASALGNSPITDLGAGGLSLPIPSGGVFNVAIAGSNAQFQVGGSPNALSAYLGAYPYASSSTNGNAFLLINGGASSGLFEIQALGAGVTSQFFMHGYSSLTSGTQQWKFGDTLGNFIAGVGQGSVGSPQGVNVGIPSGNSFNIVGNGTNVFNVNSLGEVQENGCGAGTYLKADGTGCGTPPGTGTTPCVDARGYTATGGDFGVQMNSARAAAISTGINCVDARGVAGPLWVATNVFAGQSTPVEVFWPCARIYFSVPQVIPTANSPHDFGCGGTAAGATIGAASGTQFIACVPGGPQTCGANPNSFPAFAMGAVTVTGHGQLAPVAIASFTGSSGTLIFTNTGTNVFIPGSSVALSGFSSGGAGLDGQVVTVLAAGLSSTSFEAVVTGTGYSTDTGTATFSPINALWVLGGTTPGTNAFDAVLDGVMIDMNNITNGVAYYVINFQEGTEFSRSDVVNTTLACGVYDRSDTSPGVAHYKWDDVQCTSPTIALGTYGVVVYGSNGSSCSSAAAGATEIGHSTIKGWSATYYMTQAGISIECAGNVKVDHDHVEYVNDGVATALLYASPNNTIDVNCANSVTTAHSSAGTSCVHFGAHADSSSETLDVNASVPTLVQDDILSINLPSATYGKTFTWIAGLGFTHNVPPTFAWATGTIGTSNTTAYYLWPTANTGTGTFGITTARSLKMPNACVASNFQFSASAAPTSNATFTFNDVTASTSFTHTWTAASATMSDTTDFILLNQGDAYNISITTGQATETLADVRGTFACH
jgi:hypothetical protein